MRRGMLLFFLLLATLPGFAQIYRYTDSKGIATYSDQPHPQAEVVDLSATAVSVSTKTTPTTTGPMSATQNLMATISKDLTNSSYTEFSIQLSKDEDGKPNEETFWNPENLPIVLQIKPDLQAPDLVQYFFDGKPLDKPTKQLSYQIPKVITTSNGTQQELLTRGEHTISAVLLNNSMVPLKTTPIVTVFIHYGTTQQQQQQ